jgi:tetratricopeptide (TPR) repeat protein
MGVSATSDTLDEKYKLLRVLGEGGFGEVWLAQDIVLGNRQVAIKFLKESTPEQEQQFLGEMRALAALKHAGIVTFFHHFTHEGRVALVMEYCVGGRLDHIDGHHNVRWPDLVAGWMLHLCETLSFVHERGFVHQDIKPSNLLLRDDLPIIADFGIANRSLGTPLYCSPDKRDGYVGRDDGREDIYALGMTLLELMHGEHPWRSLRGSELQAAKRARALPSELSEPAWLIEIALKAIHPEAELRFQTAAEMANALRARHVPVSIDRDVLKAQRAVIAGEAALKRSSWRLAQRRANVALSLCPRSAGALLLAGRINLMLHKTEAAYEMLKLTQHGASQYLAGLEMGWLHLQRGDLPRALSTLNDEVVRNPLNFEAHCLLLECYWQAARYDEMKRVADILLEEKCGSNAFENARLLARIGLGEVGPAELKQIVAGSKNPFVVYNANVALGGQAKLGGLNRLLQKLVFEDFRFGYAATSKSTNSVVLKIGDRRSQTTEKVISIGNLPENTIRMQGRSISRRHALIVNTANEVWIHDLQSTIGVSVDGARIERKRILMGVHDVSIGRVEIRVSANESLLA